MENRSFWLENQRKAEVSWFEFLVIGFCIGFEVNLGQKFSIILSVLRAENFLHFN